MSNLILAKHFAQLLNPQKNTARNGDHGAAENSSSDSFETWWLVKGRAAYPYWSYLSLEERNWLFEPVAKLTLGNVELDIPRAMQLTLQLRPDVIAKFAELSQNKVPDPNAMAGWFYSSGLYEHLFSELSTVELIRDLDRPVQIAATEEKTPLAGVPAISALMYLVWSMLDTKMKEVMNLSTSQTRLQYIAWFFSSALRVFRLDRLVASRWKSWLQEKIATGENLPALPRFAVLYHSLLKPEEKLDLTSLDGVAKLLQWSELQLKEKGTWHWLLEPSLLPVKLPKIFDPTKSSEDGNIEKAAQLETKTIKPASKLTPKLANKFVPRPFGLNLIGFAYGELGIGEDIRMAVAACEAAKIPYQIVNISPGDDVRQNDLTLKERIEGAKEQTRYAINVFIMPGFDMVSRLFLRHGNEVFDGYYNIGWWPWELSVWPKAWNKAFDLVDEVWAGSQFSFDMYQASTKKPSCLMPLAVSVQNVKTLNRKHFKLTEDSYLFLYIFDFNSHLKRKNPEAAIEAFQKAFPLKPSRTKGKASIPSKVDLVLKIMNAKPKDPAWLAFEKRCAEDGRIQIINQTLDREEILGLIQACDAYVSPHRAEGFGRTLAEAMLLGKPVIATNYSGNAFYMESKLTLPVDYELVPVKEGDYHFVKDEDQAVWAEPSIDHMAKQMIAAIKKTQDKVYTKNLKDWAQEQFAPIRTGKIIKKRLVSIKAKLPAKSAE